MTTGLSDFFKYNLWANLCLLDACAQLSDAQLDATTTGVYGNTRETLIHMLAAEERYASRFTEQRPEPALSEEDPFPGFDELRRRARESGEGLIAFAEHGELDRIFHLDGGTYDASAINMLIQAINHAIDHRSQITTLLSLQGIDAPALDGWSYNDATL